MIISQIYIDKELANIILRILDLAVYLQIDIHTAVLDKLNFNKTREYRHDDKKNMRSIIMNEEKTNQNESETQDKPKTKIGKFVDKVIKFFVEILAMTCAFFCFYFISNFYYGNIQNRIDYKLEKETVCLNNNIGVLEAKNCFNLEKCYNNSDKMIAIRQYGFLFTRFNSIYFKPTKEQECENTNISKILDTLDKEYQVIK